MASYWASSLSELAPHKKVGKGLDRTTVREICDHWDVSNPELYYALKGTGHILRSLRLHNSIEEVVSFYFP